jgi:hypothetical protein
MFSFYYDKTIKVQRNLRIVTKNVDKRTDSVTTSFTVNLHIFYEYRNSYSVLCMYTSVICELTYIAYLQSPRHIRKKHL